MHEIPLTYGIGHTMVLPASATAAMRTGGLPSSMAVFPHSNIFSEQISSLNKSNQNDYNGDHQKNVNEAAHGIGGDESQEP
jgi:hypothetical protein